MRYLFIFLFLSIHPFLFAQSGHQYWEWAKSYGGTGKDITADIKNKDGYLYVTGTFTSSTITWENTTLVNNGGSDIFIAKLDTNGNTIWVKNFGGAGDDTVQQLEINNNHDFVLLCRSASNNIVIGSVNIDTPKQFYAKFDLNGNILNAKKIITDVSSNDVDIDNDGNIYVTGNYISTFTFANSTVSLIPPLTPPIGAPVFYLDSIHYSYSNNGPTYTSGAAMLKYMANGNEGWIKLFHSQPVKLFLEFDNANNTIVTLFEHIGSMDFDSTYFNYTGDFRNPQLTFLAGLSPAGLVKYTDNNIGRVIDNFKIGEDGNGFVSTHINFSFSQYLTRIKNGLKFQSVNSYFYSINDFHILPYLFGTLETAEKGNIILNNSDYRDRIFILDSTLTPSDSISIAGGNNLDMTHRCAKGNALFFGDNFTIDTLHITNNNQLLPVINLYNQGSNDIFIGKYHRKGYMPLAFNTFADTIKFCYGNNMITLDSAAILKNSGARPVAFHWSPAASFENPSSLNTRVFMAADTVIAKLTITDAAGDSISKNIVFFNGIQPDIHLKLLDTAICRNGFIRLTVEGSQLINCYAQGSCDPQFTVRFDSLNQVKQLYGGSCSTVNYFKLNSDAPGYCIDTTSSKLTIYPYYSLYNSVQLCSGSSYTIPGDTTYNNITSTTRRVLSLKTAHGCDSITVTDLFVIPPGNRTETQSVCAGSNYTFPDNTTASNIQTNMDHMSTLKAIGGCDSLYIQTIITVLPVYNKTNNVSICSGANFTFPDSTVLNNIQTDISHTSHFNGHNGCDSNIITNIKVYQPYHASQNIHLCEGSNYTFPDGTTQTAVTSNISHISRLNSVQGCDSIITTNITVTPLYNHTENISICAGTNYTFADGTAIYNIRNDVTHSNHLVSISGCDSIVISNLLVTTLDTSITKTRSALKANLNDAAYQWLDCSTNTSVTGETAQAYTATLVGNYAVQLLKDGCLDTSSCYTIAFDDLLRTNGASVNIYPNPASNFLTVEFITNRPSVLQSKIIDIHGQVVLSGQKNLVAGINRLTFKVNALQRGVYSIILQNAASQEKVIKKIIIN